MSMSYVRLIVNYFPCCQAKGKASERGADGKETSFQEERLEEEDRERRSGQVVSFREMFSQARFSLVRFPNPLASGTQLTFMAVGEPD